MSTETPGNNGDAPTPTELEPAVVPARMRVRTSNAGVVELHRPVIREDGSPSGMVALRPRYGTEVHSGHVVAWLQPDGSFRLGGVSARCNRHMPVYVVAAPTTCDKCPSLPI